MKKISLSTILVFLFISIVAQTVHESINYQTLIRDLNGNYISDKNVKLRVSIIQDSPTGMGVYSEQHVVNTNDYGLINLKIGSGVSENDFSSIRWDANLFFLKIEVDIDNSGFYQEIGI